MLGLRLAPTFGIHALDLGLARGAVCGHALEAGHEVRLHATEQHAVLRTLWSSQRRTDIGQVQFQRRRIGRVRRLGVVPHALRLGIGFDQRDLLLAAAGQAQVVHGFGVDREDAARRTIFGRHVGDSGAVGQWQVLQAFAEELDELAHHAQRPEHLGHGEHQIGRSRAFRQLAGELEAHHLRNQHRGRLAEHRGLGLDPADAPAEHADAVDHRGVAVGAEHGVREGEHFAVDFTRHHDAGEIFQVDLMDDAGIGRHDLEVLQGGLAPAQEAVTLHVALELDLAVEVQRVRAAIHVDLHRMVDHQFRRNERVDQLRVATELGHGIAHRGEVDHARHAGEVLQHHAGRHEGDLGVGLGGGLPRCNRFDVVRSDRHPAVLAAQQVLQQDLHAEGQAGQVEALSELRQAEIGIRRAIDVELRAGGEGVGHWGLRCCNEDGMREETTPKRRAIMPQHAPSGSRDLRATTGNALERPRTDPYATRPSRPSTEAPISRRRSMKSHRLPPIWRHSTAARMAASNTARTSATTCGCPR